MNSEYENFIGVYHNVYPPEYCRFLVDQFDYMQSEGVGSTRRQSESGPKHRKEDYQILLNDDTIKPFHSKTGEELLTRRVFINGLQQCYDDYITKYSILQDMPSLSTTIKLQKTGPGEGYHLWHCEQGPGESAARNLVWILYLNTIEPEEAGETEFLYQQKRFRPVENTMIIWPASFTHTHRGNTVFGQNYKYIATGWFYLQS